jgi:ribosome-binding ATPase
VGLEAGMRVGICGYPGSGKSTVFAALAPGGSPSKGGVSYGNIKVPDARVDRLKAIFSPKKTTYAEITFVDFGVSGTAARGAFSSEILQHMRNADVLVHVVRVFNNPMLSDAEDPQRDVSLFNDELVLLDATVLDRRGDRWRRENKKGREVEVNATCLAHLEDGEPLRTLALSEDDVATLTGIQLLSLKPLLTLYSFSEDNWEDESHAALRETTQSNNEASLGICGELEAEIASMDDPADQAEFLEGLGLGEPARNSFIRTAYGLLDLISFLTAGEDECRAWPIRRGISARKAAGKIHSDIERGFIRAEVYRLEDLAEEGSEAALKKAGKHRVEGKEYTVVDGDVVNFRFNV